VVLGAGSAGAPVRVVRDTLDGGAIETLRAASDVELPRTFVSVAEPVSFPPRGGRTAHAFYYPPSSADHAGPADEQPPLIVVSHGGPTSAADPTFSLRVQFWTTRGFAVADVNYAGSSGFGRAYRKALDGAWGVAEVDDCVAAARWLAAQGRANPARLIIRGGSAGGYTTLAALAFRPGAFAAGASYYGVSDLERLARDTHKFEARYLDGLVGPYPEARDTYRARSPLHAADRLACPLILFQGLEDAVVPPSQSALMADAARAKGLPVAYLAFEGEQHGFRRAATIARCLEAELAFYGAVFGFTPADDLPPLAIDNLPRR
jgi:dipeptidyl aminopeptidase/acylaminoacyl peptidase